MDTSDPAAPKIVHAFMPRDTKGFTINETWDVLGMRATRSDDTVLDGAFVPDKYIAARRARRRGRRGRVRPRRSSRGRSIDFGERLLRPGAARPRRHRRAGEDEDVDRR